MKKIVALLLSMAILFSFAACGSNKNIVEEKKLPVSIGSEPKSIDPALNSTVDGSTLIVHAFAGLAGYTKNEVGGIELTADCAKELVEPKANEDGTFTYVYELKDNLKWSDGSALTAEDFVFAWNRAASPETSGGYAYMFELIDGYDDVSAIDEKGRQLYPGAQLNVTASEDGKKLTVVTTNKVDYWNELLAFSVYMPVKASAVSNDTWASSPEKYIGNGPYVLSEWEHNSKMVYKKNPHYHNAKAVTMETIEFYLSNDANNSFENFKNKDWFFIDEIPTNEIKNIMRKYSDELVINNQAGTYYINFNINKNILPSDTTLKGRSLQLAQAEIRSALALLIDRNHIVNNITQSNQVAASSFVPAGISDFSGVEFYKNAGNDAGYNGYWNVSKDAYEDNCQKAIETLKKYYKFDSKSKKFTNIPAIEYIYNASGANEAISEYLQSTLAKYGITIKPVKKDSDKYLSALQSGEFTVTHSTKIADYRDPLCFLEIWTSTSKNNTARLGNGSHKGSPMYSMDLTPYGISYKVENGTWAQTYDRLILEIKKCDKSETRFKLMHLAEDLLMQTGAIIPLYFDNDLYLINKDLHGFFASPLGIKYFMYTNY